MIRSLIDNYGREAGRMAFPLGKQMVYVLYLLRATGF